MSNAETRLSNLRKLLETVNPTPVIAATTTGERFLARNPCTTGRQEFEKGLAVIGIKLTAETPLSLAEAMAGAGSSIYWMGGRRFGKGLTSTGITEMQFQISMLILTAAMQNNPQGSPHLRRLVEVAGVGGTRGNLDAIKRAAGNIYQSEQSSYDHLGRIFAGIDTAAWHGHITSVMTRTFGISDKKEQAQLLYDMALWVQGRKGAPKKTAMKVGDIIVVEGREFAIAMTKDGAVLSRVVYPAPKQGEKFEDADKKKYIIIAGEQEAVRIDTGIRYPLVDGAPAGMVLGSTFKRTA